MTMTSGSTFLGSSSDKSISHQCECTLSNVDDCSQHVSAIPIVRKDISTTGDISNLYLTQESDKYFGLVPNNSNVCATNRAGNLNSHAQKENYQCFWRRVQKKDTNVSVFDLKNLDFSLVDDVILLSTSADTNQEKLIVPKDLRRNKSPGSLQEHESKCVKGSPISGTCLNSSTQPNDAVGSAGQISEAKSLGSAGSQTSRNIMEEQLDSKCLPHILSSLNVIVNAGQNIENIKASPGITQSKKLANCSTCIPEEDCKDAAASNFLIPGDKTSCGLQNDLRSICWAVNEAHRAQRASEAIEKDKGYPVAEFEKLLYSASPVICPSFNIRRCQVCFHGQGSPLCRHEIPNISLGNLWQWYEKHGSYGLEVKAEDRRSSKQFGIDRIKFRAYFVPFLSAVQLFKYHRAHPVYSDNGTLGSIELVDSEKNKKSESSPMVDLRLILSVLVPRPRVEDSSSLPKRNGVSDSKSSSESSNRSIFSVLVPQPRVEDPSSSPKWNGVSDSRSSSEWSDADLHHPPVDSKLSDDNVELLFEYFEQEQPQSRKPLFEKIQDLVGSEGPSSCGVYGDPSILWSARFPDLHHNSWFSVAWYPIYMIPNGNFRAAFLTYHSLGHYVDRGQTLDARCSNACVVSPIVGLQSYNSQGECWFQSRHSGDHLKEVSLDSDPPSVLRERRKTLEKTASVMSRAVRMNYRETLVNRHSDYEFFLSRRRELP